MQQCNDKKLFSMNTKFKIQVIKFLKQTFFIGCLFSSSAFIFLRVMIYPLPIEFAEDCLIFIKTVLTGWLLVITAKAAFECLVFVLEFGQWAIQKYVTPVTSNLTMGIGINLIRKNLTKAYRKVRLQEIEFYNEAVNITEVVK